MVDDKTNWWEEKGVLGYVTEPTRNTTVSVGVTSVQVCEQRLKVNPRKVLWIRNISGAAANVMTINLGGSPAVANNGIVLKDGESFVDSTGEGYECYQGFVTAICAAAAGTLAVMER